MTLSLNRLRRFVLERRRQWLSALLKQMKTPETQSPIEQKLQRVHMRIDELDRTFPLRTLSQISSGIPLKQQGKFRKHSHSRFSWTSNKHREKK